MQGIVTPLNSDTHLFREINATFCCQPWHLNPHTFAVNNGQIYFSCECICISFCFVSQVATTSEENAELEIKRSIDVFIRTHDNVGCLVVCTVNLGAQTARRKLSFFSLSLCTLGNAVEGRRVSSQMGIPFPPGFKAFEANRPTLFFLQRVSIYFCQK